MLEKILFPSHHSMNRMIFCLNRDRIWRQSLLLQNSRARRLLRQKAERNSLRRGFKMSMGLRRNRPPISNPRWAELHSHVHGRQLGLRAHVRQDRGLEQVHRQAILDGAWSNLVQHIPFSHGLLFFMFSACGGMRNTHWY